MSRIETNVDISDISKSDCIFFKKGREQLKKKFERTSISERQREGEHLRVKIEKCFGFFGGTCYAMFSFY